MSVDTFRAQAGHAPACAADPDLFHSDDPAEADAAKAICAGCPIRLGCLEGAMERHEPFGVWGGKDPYERGALTKKRRQYGPRAIDVDERRTRVVDLCERMAPAKVAEILGIPVKLVYNDRSNAGISRTYRTHAEVIDEVARLRRQGIPVPQIAVRLNVSERTVNRWVRKQRMEAA